MFKYTKLLFYFCSLTTTLFSTSATWNLNSSSTWNLNANWTPTVFPNAIDDVATFGNIITANRSITLGIPITIGTMSFDSNHNYTVAGTLANPLTFDVSSGTANLTLTALNGAGTHSISSPVVLNDTLVMTHLSTANFTISGAISGANGMTKTGIGTGSFILSNGTNSYVGPTTINKGNLTSGANGAIPAGNNVTVGDGTVDLAKLVVSVNMTAPNAFAATINSNGTLAPNTGITTFLSSLQGSGAIVLSTSTSDFNIGGSTNTIYSGAISGGAGTTSSNPESSPRLTKTGTSVLTVTGVSNYLSRTFIANGIVEAQNSLSLGSIGTSSGVYVRAINTQGTLNLNGNGLNLNKALFLNGAGFSGNGALHNIGGNNTVSGGIQIGWLGGTEITATNATINVDPSTVLNLSGVISGASNLTLTGTGTIAFSGSIGNTMTGLVTVNAGILQLNKSGVNAIGGSVTINPTATLTLLAPNQIFNSGVVTIAGGTFDLAGNVDTIGGLIYNSGTLTQGGAVLSINNATTTALSVQDVTILGDLAFTGAGGVTYAPSGTPTGATIAGNLNLGIAAHTFDIADGAAAVDLNISGVISGTASSSTVVVNKSMGSGVLQFSGTNANTYTGTTTVSSGELQLNKPNGINAIGGTVAINTGGTVTILADDQIINTSIVTIGGGTLNLNSHPETIGSLIFNSGTLLQGGGLLSINNATSTALSLEDVTIAGDIALTAAGGVIYTPSGTPTGSGISGNLNLGGAAHTFNIADGGAAIDLNISGQITGTGTATTVVISKTTGMGIMQFSGPSANTYTGTTTIGAGTLELDKPDGTNAVGGALTINTGGTVTLLADEQLISTSNVTITGGTFNLNNHSETFALLNYNSGTLTQGGGLLSLTSSGTALNMQGGLNITGPLQITGGGTILFNSGVNGTATLSGPLNIGSTITTFNIPNGTAPIEMVVSGVISGAALTKSGTGFLQFTGNASNVYTGLTTVTNGTLQLAKTTGFAVGGDILITGGTLTLAGSNQIPDTSLVTQTNGIFDLGAFSETIGTYDFQVGTFTSSGATLTLANSGIALSMRGSRTISTPLVVAGGGDIVFNGVSGTGTISGSLDLTTITPTFNTGGGTSTIDMLVSGPITSSGAGLVKAGEGQLQFAGGDSNTYTGLTTVTAGVLSLNKSTGFIAIPNDVLINGGTLLLSGAEQIADSSTITLNSGTFDLSGFTETVATLNYQGGTLSQEGAILSLASPSLALSMRDTTITGPIQIAQGGNVVFDNVNDGMAEIDGAVDLGGFMVDFDIAHGTSLEDMLISGVVTNGGLTKMGEGTLVLRGANTYQGGTFVSAGTLKGDAISLQGNITNNANLIFDHNIAGTYPDSISGSGLVVKQGDGSLNLSGLNMVGGTTSVNEGILIVNGTLDGLGELFVNAGAILGGTGTIAKNVTLNGFLYPGNSIGTIHLIGEQVFASGSTLEIELNPTSSDLVDIVGSLTIQPGSTLSLVPDLSEYPKDFLYTIIQTTDGLTGTFTVVKSPSIVFGASITYTPLDVLLELTITPFSKLVGKGNALSIASCLDGGNVIEGSDLARIIETIRLVPTKSAIETALLQLQPSLFTALAIALEDKVLYVSNAILNRLDTFSHSCDLENNQRTHLWVTALGGNSYQKGRSSEPGFHAASPGVAIGFDGTIGQNVCLGFNASYTYTHLRWQQHHGKANIQGVSGGLYGKWFGKRGYLEGAILGGYDFYYTNRHIQFATVNRHAEGFHRGYEGSAHLKGALNI